MKSPATPLSLIVAACCALVALPATAQTNFSFQLFGQGETPAVHTDATGSCVGVLSEDETTFTLSCTHDVEGALATHIHRGLPGQAGPIIFDLGDASSPIQAIWHPSPSEVILLQAGALYVNIHTAAHPAGEIRGQIRPEQNNAGNRIVFPLTGDQEVPPVDTAAIGACLADLEIHQEPLVPGKTADLHLRCAHTVSDPTMAHVHLGERGEDGPILYDLGDPSSPIEADVHIDENDTVTQLLAGSLYVNVHSTAEPDGEIRGQIAGCIEDEDTLCLGDGRFTVDVRWRTTTDAGSGHPRRVTDDSGLFWFFRPSNLELLVKVLDGCGVNGHYWVFLAGTTNVAYTVTVTDTLGDQTRTYQNDLGITAVTQTDTEAFDTCP